MILRICLTVLCLLCLAGTAAPAAERRLVTVAHDPTSPPMEFMQKGEITGYIVDYIAAVAQEADFLVVHKPIVWDGSFAGLYGKKYDVMGAFLVATPERTSVVSFSDPYCEVRLVLITPKNINATSMDDMKGEDVGALFGSTAFAAIKKTPGIRALAFENFDFAMADLAQNRIDAVVCDDITAVNYLKNKNYADKLKIAFVLPDEKPLPCAFAVRQGDKRLLELLNKGIAAVKAKGIESKLKKKWLER